MNSSIGCWIEPGTCGIIVFAQPAGVAQLAELLICRCASELSRRLPREMQGVPEEKGTKTPPYLEPKGRGDNSMAGKRPVSRNISGEKSVSYGVHGESLIA